MIAAFGDMFLKTCNSENVKGHSAPGQLSSELSVNGAAAKTV